MVDAYFLHSPSLIVALLPICTGLNCYVCAYGSTGCNDPFDANGSGVTTLNLNSNTYCTVGIAMKCFVDLFFYPFQKSTASGIVVRAGASSCTEASVFGMGTYCCQTDLCNRGGRQLLERKLVERQLRDVNWAKSQLVDTKIGRIVNCSRDLINVFPK
jgi:hypothetical protein